VRLPVGQAIESSTFTAHTSVSGNATSPSPFTLQMRKRIEGSSRERPYDSRAVTPLTGGRPV